MKKIDSKKKWDEEAIREVLQNPLYCIGIDKIMTPIVTKEQWIKSQIRLINEEGAELYAKTLLSIMTKIFKENYFI